MVTVTAAMAMATGMDTDMATATEDMAMEDTDMDTEDMAMEDMDMDTEDMDMVVMGTAMAMDTVDTAMGVMAMGTVMAAITRDQLKLMLLKR